MTTPVPIDRDIARAARAWPFEEARKLLKRFEAGAPAKGYALFETGYGPSGLPHIGTFGEVLRTTMVRRAFEAMSDIPTRLIAFSDDMDGLRKVPDNVPNGDMLARHLDLPLTRVPDPFGCCESFGHYNNRELQKFLDRFGFDYEFRSSSEMYRSGAFDGALRLVLERYDAVMKVMLPSLRAERRATYSPFLPISPKSGKVLQVPLIAHDAAAGTIAFEDEDGARVEVPVTGGHCKLQWKPDWAMRWVALGVDYEMSGKDLIDSVKLGGKIARALGGTPPEGFNYELFLDENGEKISKSKGNGLSIEEWLAYGPPESLSYYMFQKPRQAKKLYFDVIPRATDDYLAHGRAFADEPPERALENPVWHIHGGARPSHETPVGFAMLLNLASAAASDDKAVLWGFIQSYAPEASPESHPFLDRLVENAIRYYEDRVKPTQAHRVADDRERAAIEDLAARLAAAPADADAEALQGIVYAVGKEHGFEPLRDWFRALYEVLFGQSQGPRMGSFFALYGREASLELIARALAGALVEA